MQPDGPANAMEIKPIILVLADISGYTRFIKFHRVSLIHAEKIITDLLEAIISAARSPLVLHEIEGDAVSFYAFDENEGAYCADVFAQVEQFFESFQLREAELISECGVCQCEACQRVGQLKMKAVLHRGRAVFTKLRQFTKVAGEDVILAHRLLKNSVPSDEYILMTDAFREVCGGLAGRKLERRTEHAEGLGDVPVHLLDLERTGPVEPAVRSVWEKIRTQARLEGYLARRLILGRRRTFRNLQEM